MHNGGSHVLNRKKLSFYILFHNSLVLWFGISNWILGNFIFFLVMKTVLDLVLCTVTCNTKFSLESFHRKQCLLQCTLCQKTDVHECRYFHTLTEFRKMVLYTGHLLSGDSHDLCDWMPSLFSFQYYTSKLWFGNVFCSNLFHSYIAYKR